MKATPAPISVTDFCQAMIMDRIVVNREYQRDDRVWSSFVRSYFIESILLEYPIPKIYLYVKYDIKTKLSVKEIVDGQQRSQALRAFYENKLRLSTRLDTVELRGKRYRDLTEELQGVFLSYSLSVDEFSGVGEDEIRESFARMNANNYSLNAEELRNARFQGEFKQFILRLTKAFREEFLSKGLISKRDIIRMADTKMIADAFAVMDSGFETTRPTDIDALYGKYDVDFKDQDIWFDTLRSLLNEWLSGEYWQYGELNTKHTFYTLVAALQERKSPGSVVEKMTPQQREVLDTAMAVDCSLTELNESIRTAKVKEEDAIAPEQVFPDFAAACTAKTNVGHEKLVRFSYLLSALSRE